MVLFWWSHLAAFSSWVAMPCLRASTEVHTTRTPHAAGCGLLSSTSILPLCACTGRASFCVAGLQWRPCGPASPCDMPAVLLELTMYPACDEAGTGADTQSASCSAAMGVASRACARVLPHRTAGALAHEWLQPNVLAAGISDCPLGWVFKGLSAAGGIEGSPCERRMRGGCAGVSTMPMRADLGGLCALLLLLDSHASRVPGR